MLNLGNFSACGFGTCESSVLLYYFCIYLSIRIDWCAEIRTVWVGKLDNNVLALKNRLFVNYVGATFIKQRFFYYTVYFDFISLNVMGLLIDVIEISRCLTPRL